MNKDKVTNICGLVIVVAGALVAADQSHQINLPAGVDGTLSIMIAVATALIGYMTGKPNTPK